MHLPEMLRRRDPVLLGLGVVAAAIFLVALILRPPPALPPDSANFGAPAPIEATRRQATPGLTYAIDTLGANGKEWPIGRVPRIRAGSITVTGWAIDPGTLGPGRTIEVSVDGAPGLAVTTYPTLRPDVAAALTAPAAALSGFTAVVPVARLRPGSHTLRITLVGRSGAPIVFPTAVHFVLDQGPAKIPS